MLPTFATRTLKTTYIYAGVYFAYKVACHRRPLYKLSPFSDKPGNNAHPLRDESPD